MNTVPTIVPGSITDIGGLAVRPVYFLKLNGANNPTLVVKGEANVSHGATSVAWGAKLMKNVNDSQVNTKVMTPTEIQEFKAAVSGSFQATDKQAQWIAGTFMWVKMPFVPGLSDAGMDTRGLTWTRTKKGFIGKGDEGTATDVANIKRSIPKLCDSNYWRELGKVVAVDVFIGNGDRFNLDSGQWSNSGNLMFVHRGLSYHAIGLDTLDPNSGFCDGSQVTRANLTRRGTYGALGILNDPSRRNQFAEAATRSVGTKMAEQLRGHVTITTEVGGLDGRLAMRSLDVDKELPTLFVKFASAFEQGLMMGAMDLKTYLQRKVVQYKTMHPQAVAAPLPGPMRPMPLGRNMAGLPGQHRGGVPVPPGPPARPVNDAPTKSMPAGVLDRMRYLGW